jgi:hypothetical protein
MLATGRVEEGVGGRERASSWERGVRHQAARHGRRLGPGRVRALAAGANLTYAAALGAVYGLLRSRLPGRAATRTALVSALSYAMHLPRRAEPGPPAELSPVFGLVTAAAFDALAGR